MNDINSKTHTDYPITNPHWKLMSNGVPSAVWKLM